jgi:hypothetical protein
LGNEYQAPLGIGKFLIAEIPQPELKYIDYQTANTDEKRFKERLDEAYKILPKIESDLKKGEWADVVKQCRELLELIKKDMIKFIQGTIYQTTCKNRKFFYYVHR